MVNEKYFTLDLLQALKSAFVNENVSIQLEYSVIAPNGSRRIIDILFEHPELGVFVIEVKPYEISQLTSVSKKSWSVQNWPSSIASPYEQGLIYLQSLLSQKDYSNKQQKQGHVLIALPNISRTEWLKKKESLAYNVIDIIIFADDLEPKKLREKISQARPVDRSNYLGPSKLREKFPEIKHEIFVSYRREDSAWAAGRIKDYLMTNFGEEKIFFDTHSIRPGKSFKKYIQEQISTSNLVLVVIGPQWLTLSHSDSGKRRLDDPKDFVKWEVSLAIENNLEIIPILLDGTPMPHREHLPKGLQKLPDYNAYELTAKSFSREIKNLCEKLEEILKEIEAGRK